VLVSIRSLGAIVLPTRWLHDSTEHTKRMRELLNTMTAYDAISILKKHLWKDESLVASLAMEAGEDSEPFKCCRDPLSELAFHGAFKRYPLRTVDPIEADFFIVLTLISPLMAWGYFNTDKNCTYFDDAFDALTSHPLFINDDHGKHHIIINLIYLCFPQKHKSQLSLSGSYPRLQNDIVANRFDPLETYQIMKGWRAKGHDYEDFFGREGSLVGSGLEAHIPLVVASMKRFDESKYYIFYRRRTRRSTNNSTQYRHAPLKLSEKMAPSSIGNDLPEQEWL